MGAQLTSEEANLILRFLDRVAVTGHQERQAMNAVVDRLIPIAQPSQAPAPAAPPEE